MALEAPGHAVWLGVINHRHMIDRAVAAEATDPAIYVRGMIIKNVVGCAMNLHPLDRFARLPALAHRFELRVVLRHLGMTVHASLGVGQIGVCRHLNKAVAITAIHPEL